jgi:hypothetical protein
MSTGIDKATSYDGMDTVDMTMSVVICQEKRQMLRHASEEARQTIQWMGQHGNTYRKVEVIFDIKHRVHAHIVTACQMHRAHGPCRTDVQMRSQLQVWEQSCRRKKTDPQEPE